MILILYCLIPMLASAAFTDKCKAIKGKTKNNINGYATGTPIEDIIKSKKSKVKKGVLSGVFDEVAIFNHDVEGVSQEVVAKRVRKTIPDDLAGYQAQHDSEMVEDKMLYCEFDHNNVFILKGAFRLTTECPDIDGQAFWEKKTDPIVYKLVNNKLVGSIQSLRGSLNKLEQMDLGPLGDIKFFRTDDGHNLLIRILPRSQAPMKDIYFTKIFNDETYGAKYRGCYVDRDWVFLIQGAFYNHCDDYYFLENYRTLSVVERLKFMLKLAKAVNAFNMLGYVHNFVQPSNFLLDTEREPHLVNFKYSALSLTMADPADKANPFMAPIRSKRNWVSDMFDLYSLAATFVALESFQGSELYKTDPDTGLPREEENYPINEALRNDYMFRVLEKVIKPIYDVQLFSIKKIVVKDFGTALYKILLDMDASMYVVDFVKIIEKEIAARSSAQGSQQII